MVEQLTSMPKVVIGEKFKIKAAKMRKGGRRREKIVLGIPLLAFKDI